MRNGKSIAHARPFDIPGSLSDDDGLRLNALEVTDPEKSFQVVSVVEGIMVLGSSI